MNDHLTRRNLLLGASGAAVAASMPKAALAFSRGIDLGIEQLDYGDVALLDGRARAQFDGTLSALLAFDDDELLRPYREAIGAPVGPRKLAGWYDRSAAFDPPRVMTGFIPGHSFGQYVSALARGYAVSGDARAKAKVERLIAGFAPTISTAFYEDYPLPAYTYDKIVVGLIDAHQFAGNRQALRLLDPATDAVAPYLPGRALDRQIVERQKHKNAAFGWDETYTLPENLYIAAERGAGERFRRMARAYLLDDAYFDPLAAGRNVLPGRHAYSHVNALASAMRAHFADGSARHLAAARNGFGFVIDQSFATGGWGPNEGFVEPGSGALGKSLETSHGSFETPCGTYGHFKVARYLMRATGDSRYGDSMERLLYNAALGALPLRPDGTAFYYSDYNDVGARTYYGDKCPCCSGTIGQLTADYGISAYLRDARGLYVNLYLPSRAVWRRAGEPALTLTQRGAYPLDDRVEMNIAAPRPVSMALRLRIPAWAGPGTRLWVNGRALTGAVVPGRFATVSRTWRGGDRIMLVLDRTLRAEAVDAEHPTRVAMMLGPLALFATGGGFTPLAEERLRTLTQRAPGSSEWRIAGVSQSFKPFFAIETEPTRLYQHIA
jgi:DUF1680 family protein